jgi:aspartyl protease family protein
MIEIDPSDRVTRPESSRKSTGVWFLALAAAVVGALAALVLAGVIQNPFVEPPPTDRFADLYKTYAMPPLDPAAERRGEITRPLLILQKERCDTTAILSLGNALKAAGYNREASQVFYGFAMACNKQNGLLYQAADILYGLSDFEGAKKITDMLVAEWPENNLFHYLSGLVAAGQGRYGTAVIEIENTIELAPSRPALLEDVFLNLAKAFAHLNAPCKSAAAVQQWIALDPATRDNVAAKKILTDYLSQGNCAATYADGSDSFPVGPRNMTLARVTINNVSGQFVIDTGANLVTLSADFARRTGIKSDIEGFIQTANGGSHARLGAASLVRAGRVSAADVPVVLLSDDAAGLPSHLDGLLGMSFLSRFNVEIARGTITLSPHR